MRAISYIHPVLNTGDAIIPGLSRDNVEKSFYQATYDDFIFSFTLMQEDPYITGLIEKGDAEYAIIVECNNSLYRRCYKKNENTFNIFVPRKQVCGEIYFRPYIMTTKPISYNNPRAHKDYENETFELGRGDILAEFNISHYNAEIDYNKLASFDSIISVERNPNQKVKNVTYNTEGKKICIILPYDDFDKFMFFREDSRYKFTIHSSLVLNALLVALYQNDFAQDIDEETKIWKASIRYVVKNTKSLSKFNLEDKNCYPELAQALLQMPFANMIKSIVESKQQTVL